MNIHNNQNLNHGTRAILLLLGSYVALGIALFGIADNAKEVICRPSGLLTPAMTMTHVVESLFVFLVCLGFAIYTARLGRGQDQDKFAEAVISYCIFVPLLVLFVCSMTGISPPEIIEAFFGDPHEGKIYKLAVGYEGPRYCR